MVMTISVIKGPSSIRKTPDEILRRYADDDYCLELLRFFGTHPAARFSELAIIHAMNDYYKKTRIRSALGRLIIDGVIVACMENCTHLYKLTDDTSVREPVVYLAQMDWCRWRRAAGQVPDPLQRNTG